MQPTSEMSTSEKKWGQQTKTATPKKQNHAFVSWETGEERHRQRQGSKYERVQTWAHIAIYGDQWLRQQVWLQGSNLL